MQEINHLHQQEGIAAVAQPWLPPLKERITLDELDKVVPIEAWQKRTAPSVLIGVADIPQAQKQEAVAIDLSKMGISSFTEVQVQERPLSSRQPQWIWLASRVQKI